MRTISAVTLGQIIENDNTKEGEGENGSETTGQDE